LEEIRRGLEDGFFLSAGFGTLGVFIWAAIRLKYHPASRLRWRASKPGARKFMLSGGTVLRFVSLRIGLYEF
jgi:hypothetical protein